ncbi:DJ-1/PfpI family protein [Alteribacter aurantiacus]|uniref:DJ-1/PfpI family protein n=1 Tax=Alteribacter aurantiacus TaxID=254410 RepID=UPI000409F07D|nr:DJ-1/PfpI family protein [Alteribacter aurantiacus]
MTKEWSVGIFLFDEVEVLDFAGPFEVFSVTVDDHGQQPFCVHTISEKGGQIQARNGLRVLSDFDMKHAPPLDILIVPGGYGTRDIESNEQMIKWIKAQSEKVELVVSVCTGSFLLAKAGLLNGKSATTHWESAERMGLQFPNLTVKTGVKFVDEGSVITAAGISAGIDMSFHLVKRLLGAEIARKTAKEMEYDINL